MEADKEHCHKCNAEMPWVPVRGGKRLKCTGCGDTFPCYNACTHADCCSERGVRVPSWVKVTNE